MVLKRFLPRGLYGRAALILIVPIVTIQLVVSMAFIQRHYEGVTRQMTQGVAMELALVLQEFDKGATAGEALARARVVAEPLEVALTLPPGPEAPAEDRAGRFDVAGKTIVATLHDALPRLIAADVTDPGRIARLRIDTALGPVQADVSRRRMGASNPHQLLVLMILTSVLMTVIAYLFLRNQLRPITRLAEAAEAFGKGQRIVYRPRGALEVRAAGAAFIDMRARIERQIEQRTLLLSGVSHDLRTPLTRLRLGLSLLPEDEETRALMQDVAQMERMVDEFLSFARGDAMEEMEQADAQALVARVVEDVRRGGGAVALAGVEGEPGPVRLRPHAVARAVENLIGNALRHGRRAEVRLVFTDRSLRIFVEDDGPGIPAERREEAMRPFTRLDAERDPNRGGGVGLGLSIAADVARNHGGGLYLGDSETLGGLKAELVLAR
ncbi:two-component sensor histidine kinase [Rhodobacter sp. SGA-6-6]|uniref:ATP-binding protein n=1 Tax=Rhodobacter sp. SGA-6-6 TaxID=2710882 RepID=UPI0013EC3DA1|nr:ATP-binding protein [Rhodobacter sp. SGA-6-6]NGM47691.1 two-component sensor histidine kinase [Rhodobacter sp. SGA-6-6]